VEGAGPISARSGRLTPEQLRECLIQLAPYAGYPNVADFTAPTEEIIAAFEARERARVRPVRAGPGLEIRTRKRYNPTSVTSAASSPMAM